MTIIDQLAAKIEPLEKACNLAMWNLLVTGNNKYAEELKSTKVALKKVFASKEDYEKVLHTTILRVPVKRTLLLQSFIPKPDPARPDREDRCPRVGGGVDLHQL